MSQSSRHVISQRKRFNRISYNIIVIILIYFILYTSYYDSRFPLANKIDPMCACARCLWPTTVKLLRQTVPVALSKQKARMHEILSNYNCIMLRFLYKNIKYIYYYYRLLLMADLHDRAKSIRSIIYEYTAVLMLYIFMLLLHHL